MRAKTEFPTIHGDQHNPDGGSDPLTWLSGLVPRIVRGQVFNDADIIAGTGFGATLTDVNEVTVTFDVPFDDPPTVVTTPNNNNPADVSGEYGVSQTSVTAGGFVVVSTEFDGTTLFMGGFNFVAVETEPAA